MQNKFLNSNLTKNLFTISIFLILFFIGYQIYTDFGFYIDEKFHRANGFYWLNFLSIFFGNDNLFELSKLKYDQIQGFTLPSIEEWNLYSVIFDVPAAYLELVFNLETHREYYEMRHFLVFITFFFSSIFFYKLLINRFNNYLVSIFGLLLFILTPRIFGDSFWNNKDIIFLSFYIFSIYNYFKFLDNKSLGNLFWLSFFSAISSSIRLAGIFLPITFIFFYLIDKISKRNDMKGNLVIIYITLFFLILFISSPFLWNDFLYGLLSSLNLDMSWRGKVHFLGNYYPSDHLPYYYLIFWIIISTPVIHLILFVFGFANYLKRLALRYFEIRKSVIYNDLWRSKNEKKDFLISINLIFFFCLLSFMNINLYNSWRLAYFLYIFIIYFSTYFIYLLFLRFKENLKLIISIFCVSFIFLIYRNILYHPYQSLYFNFLVPKSVKNIVDVDYTGLSGYHFLKEVSGVKQKKYPIIVAVNSWYPLWRMTELLDEDKKSKILVISNNKENADFIYSNRIYDVDKRYHKKYDIPKKFKKQKYYKIDNTIIYEIYEKVK